VVEEVDACSLWEGEQEDDEEAMDDDGEALVVLGDAWSGALEPSDGGGACCWLVVGASCGAARCCLLRAFFPIVGD